MPNILNSKKTKPNYFHTSEEEVSCLTTGELVSGGAIHVLPVTDVVPLDVLGSTKLE